MKGEQVTYSKGSSNLSAVFGIYSFTEFLPEAVAVFSGREFDASRDRSRFLETLGLSPGRFCDLEQVHGNRVHVTSRPFSRREGDGLLTRGRGLALLIRTADCVPVFFLDRKVGAAGICHAGWRGARQGIVGKMIEGFAQEFGSKNESIQAAIGPAIREMCYEVGPEFEGYFPGRVRLKGRRRFFDLVGVLKEQLSQAGIRSEAISDCGFCTACSVDRFFSARREGTETGRLISAIVLK